MISYRKYFEMLKTLGLSEKKVEELYDIPSSLHQKMRKNENITTYRLDKICNSFKCNLSDICENVHDDNYFNPTDY